MTTTDDSLTIGYAGVAIGEQHPATRQNPLAFSLGSLFLVMTLACICSALVANIGPIFGGMLTLDAVLSLGVTMTYASKVKRQQIVPTYLECCGVFFRCVTLLGIVLYIGGFVLIAISIVICLTAMSIGGPAWIGAICAEIGALVLFYMAIREVLTSPLRFCVRKRIAHAAPLVESQSLRSSYAH